MSKIKRLVDSYKKFISIPWRDDMAAAQRVIFCVYSEHDELTIRANLEEFELVTKDSKHDWALFDLTDTFGVWLSSQKYAKSYFKQPSKLDTLIRKYLDYIDTEFKKYIDDRDVTENTVVALKGVGSLFGFVKVKDVVDRLSPNVKGRLLVFFPGSYENNNYRLLDRYDGWNYLAVPITAEK